MTSLKKWHVLAVGTLALLSVAAIKFFTDYPNGTPTDTDFFVYQRNQSYGNASGAQTKSYFWANPQFTGNGSISGAFGIGGFSTVGGNLTVSGNISGTGIFAGNGSGLTNVGSGVFLAKTNDIGNQETFVGPTTFVGTGNGVILGSGTYLFDHITNQVAWWSTDGSLSNVLIGANLQLANGVLSGTSGSTNSSTTATNMYTYNTNAMGYGIVTNALQALNATANSAAIFDGAKQLTNAVNAHGVFTNTASGPPSFGLLQNTEMQNSTITIQGAAVSLGGSTLAPGSSPFFNANNITNVLGTNIVGGIRIVPYDGSFLWPGDTIPATWTTNTPGAGSGAIQSAGPTIKAWSISQTASNRWLLQLNMPADWDGGNVTFTVNVVSGTNTATVNALTNVWAVSASLVGTALGTVVAVTNKLPVGTALIRTNFDMAGVTIAGSPAPSDLVQFQIESRAGNTPWSGTNTELYVGGFIRYNATNTPNGLITWP